MKQLNALLKTSQEIPVYRALILETFFTSTHFKEVLNSKLKAYELSLEQFNVLRILKGQQGKPLNLKDIQERMVTKMSNTSRLIDKLIAKDLVVRKQCEQNRRKIEIAITDAGLKLIALASETVLETEKDITKSLNEQEIETLVTLLNKVRTQ